MPVSEAIAKLQPHVDVPVIVPPLPGRWTAERGHVGWWITDEGVRAGALALRGPDQSLNIYYGQARFDGCGDRSTAVRTDVLGQPALVKESAYARGHEWLIVWSTLIWPVTPTGSTGRYGLRGSFEGWQLIEMAEAMELARLAATDHHPGC